MNGRNASPVAVSFLFLAIMLSSDVLSAGSRRRAVAVSPPTEELALTFVDRIETADGTVDAGTLAWDGKRGKGASSTRTFGLRIGRASREARGTATLRAFLEMASTRGTTVRIDGIVLGTAPRTIQSLSPIGITVLHRLDIEVPPDASEGAIDVTIRWEVTND